MNAKVENNHTPQTRTQKIGDAEIPCLFYEGDGPPLIFLHATGFLPWLWHPLARELADSYRIFAPYFCDHRETDPENGGLNWMTLAEDLSRFCESLHLEKPFLVGHSMGATVSMMANATGGLPAAGMVLIEPILLPPEFYKTPHQRGAASARLQGDPADELLAEPGRGHDLSPLPFPVPGLG